MAIESLIFSQLLCNEEYARKVLPHIHEGYFNSNEERMFLKIYHRFFTKYNRVPNRQTMLLEIEKLKGSAEAYKQMVSFVDEKVEFTESLDYLVEQTEEFCKEKALFNALRESVLIVDGADKEKRGPNAIPTILSAALAICFDTTVGHDYDDDAEARYDYYHSTTARVDTGIRIIDKITRKGFPKKTLNVLLAPPHGGKTITMVNIAEGALKQGHNVLYISMEMAAEEIAKRFDVNRLDIDFDMLETVPKDIFTTKLKKLKKASYGKLIIKEYGTGTAAASNFRTLLGELKTKRGFTPDMIVIDYMNICASEFYKNGSNHNSYTIVGSIGKELRALAIESNSVVLTATQTNRSGIDNSELSMTTVSDSAATAMIADFIMGIINTSELKELNQLLFQQIKNRYDGIGNPEKFIMGVNYSKMQIYELDQSHTFHKATNSDDTSGKSKKRGKGGSDSKLNTPSQSEVDMKFQIQPDYNDFIYEE